MDLTGKLLNPAGFTAAVLTENELRTGVNWGNMALAEGGWESTWPVSFPWDPSVYLTHIPECCSSLEPPAPFLLAVSSAVSLAETPAAGPALLVPWFSLDTSVRDSVKGVYFGRCPQIS